MAFGVKLGFLKKGMGLRACGVGLGKFFDLRDEIGRCWVEANRAKYQHGQLQKFPSTNVNILIFLQSLCLISKIQCYQTCNLTF